jgi:hypothetical protein
VTGRMLPGRVEEIAVLASRALREARRVGSSCDQNTMLIVNLQNQLEDVRTEFTAITARLVELEERFADHLEGVPVPPPV